jgi:hypothetical protein
MRDLGEEQILDRLLTIENSGEAQRRAELTDERFLTLIHDPETDRGYIVRHGVDDTEGVEIPEGTEFYEYPDLEEAERVYNDMLAEARQAGELVEEDSDEDVGDAETGGPDLRLKDRYSAVDEDPEVVPEPPEELEEDPLA